MINKRIHAIQAQQGEQVREIKLAQGKSLEVRQRLFHHSKKATKLMLSESELNSLTASTQDKNKCVIL